MPISLKNQGVIVMITAFPNSSTPSLLSLSSTKGVVNMPTHFSHTSAISLPQSLIPLANGQVESYTMPLLTPIQSINEASDVAAEIAPIVMQICAATDWDYGEIWIPSDDSTVLELSPVGHIVPETANLLSLEQFRLCSEGLIVSPGEGLPGRVWLSGQSELIADATAESESYWLRNQLAKAFDISAGFATPVIINVQHAQKKALLCGQMLAVMVFFKSGNR
jgi:hypothetical protein